MPVTLVVEGRLMETNFKPAGVDKEFVEGYVKDKGLKMKEVVLFTLDKERVYLQPRGKKYIAENVAVSA